MARSGALGKIYEDGEPIVREGEEGDCMYVVKQGQVEVVTDNNGVELQLMVLGAGEPFGEMAIVEKAVRMATVRAVGQARVLTIDKKSFLRQIHNDPSLAYRIVQAMSRRVRMGRKSCRTKS